MKIRMHMTNAALKDAGYSIEQESIIYDTQLEEIMKDPRKYLDTFETMVTYKVRWKDYRNTSPVIPHKYAKQKSL